MHIREIRNPQHFQDLCQQLLIAEYPDAVTVDDLRGDKGIDIYIPATKTLVAVYCPRKDSTLNKTIKEKIKEDIEKASRLPDGTYQIENFTFLTPFPLTEDVYRYFKKVSKNFAFKFTELKNDKYLINLFIKHSELRGQFPDLIMPDLEDQLNKAEKNIITNTTNLINDLFSKIVPSLNSDNIIQTEEDRINFLKSSLEKYKENLRWRISGHHQYQKILKEKEFSDEIFGGFESIFVFPTLVRRSRERLTQQTSEPQIFRKEYDSSDEKFRQENQPLTVNFSLTLDELLEPKVHSIIRAAPGAGKTSLLRYLALQTLNADDRLTVFVEVKQLREIDLRDVSGGLGEVLFGYAFQNNGELHLTNGDCKSLYDFFINELLAGKVTIFLDGLDEAGESKIFNQLSDLIEGFTRSDFRNNTLLVSTRPYVLRYANLSGLMEVEIMPFANRQIYQFLNSYFKDAHSAEKTKILLKRHQHLLEMARNPLLLKIIADFMSSGRDIGKSRLDLYCAMTEELVRKIDTAKRLERFAFQIPDRNGSKKLQFLKQLAFDSLFDETLQSAGINGKEYKNRFLLTDEMLNEKAIEFVEKFSLINVDPLALADDIKITPLLYEIKSGLYSFAHSTIQEYLAAEILKGRSDRDKIIFRIYFDPVLVEREVLPMMLGLLDDPMPIFRLIEQLPDTLTFTNVRLRARALGYDAHVSKNDISELFEFLLDAIQIESAFWKALAPSFSVDNDEVSRFFVEKLMRISEEDNGGELETRAIEAIRLLGTSASLAFAADAIVNGQKRFTKIDSLSILNDVGNQKHVNHLLLNLYDKDPYLNGRAAITLSHLILRSEANKDEIVNHFLRRICELNDDKFAANNIAAALGKIASDQHLEEIIRLIEDEKTINRETLTSALGYSYSELACSALQNFAEQESLAFYAINALGFLGHNCAVKSLINILRSEEDHVLRSRAALALGRIKAQSAFSLLIDSLQDKNEDVRIFSAYALGKIGDKRAALPLLNLVQNENSFEVLSYVITALGELEVSEAADFIETLKIDQDISLRAAVVGVLGDLKQEKLLKQYLSDLLKDSPLIKTKLAKTLRKFRTPTRVEPLLTLLNDRNPEVREAAAKALTEINIPELAEGILMSLSSDDIQTKKTALQRFCYYHNDPRLLEKLSTIAQQDENPSIRTIAFEAAKNYLEKLSVLEILMV